MDTDGPTSSTVRERLIELTNRKKAEQEAEADQARAKKPTSVAIDFGDSDEEDEDQIDETAHERGEGGTVASAAGAEEEENLVVTEEDKAFIDDDGVAPENQIDFGDDEDVGQYDEALEVEDVDEIEQMFSKRKRRESLSEAEARTIVENLLAQMEVAVEEDMKNYEEGKPAVHKLRLLTKVEDVLSTQRLQNELLDGGLLGVLKAWIEPMPDGTLPNTKIRSSVLKLLGLLPVDCSFEDRKAQLKRSGLGRAVLFLAKVPDEIPSNRRMAQDLVEKWSRPILAARQTHKGEDAEELRILAARKARLASSKTEVRGMSLPCSHDSSPNLSVPVHGRRGARVQEQVEYKAEEHEVALKPGEPGFRWHASIPRAATLDYVRRPEPKVAVADSRASSSTKDKSEHKLTKKLKTMSKGGQFGRAANVSVEGRNVTIQH